MSRIVSVSFEKTGNGNASFKIYNQMLKEHQILSTKEISGKYLRELAQWKDYYHNHQSPTEELLESHKILFLITAEQVIGAYIEHGDYSTVIALLQSGQYSDRNPSVELARSLIKDAYLKCTDIVTSQEILSIIISCLCHKAYWRRDVCTYFINTNIHSDDTNEEFWLILSFLVEDANLACDKREGLIQIVCTMIDALATVDFESFSIKICEALDNRRLKRKFLASQLIKLLLLSSPSSACNVAKLTSKLLIAVANIQSKYELFFDELYSSIYSSGYSPVDLARFSSSLDPLPRIELILLVLERKYRLGSNLVKSTNLIDRTVKILINLPNTKIQSRSNAEEVKDCFPYRLVRQLLVALWQLCDLDNGFNILHAHSARLISILEQFNENSSPSAEELALVSAIAKQVLL